jgi:hypothetical protein
MSRHIVAATLAAFALASILTPAAASARSLGPAALAVGTSNATQPGGFHWPHHYTTTYNSNIFGLGTGGLGSGGPGGCPPSICGRPHPQVR